MSKSLKKFKTKEEIQNEMNKWSEGQIREYLKKHDGGKGILSKKKWQFIQECAEISLSNHVEKIMSKSLKKFKTKEEIQNEMNKWSEGQIREYLKKHDGGKGILSKKKWQFIQECAEISLSNHVEKIRKFAEDLVKQRSEIKNRVEKLRKAEELENQKASYWKLPLKLANDGDLKKRVKSYEDICKLNEESSDDSVLKKFAEDVLNAHKVKSNKLLRIPTELLVKMYLDAKKHNNKSGMKTLIPHIQSGIKHDIKYKDSDSISKYIGEIDDVKDSKVASLVADASRILFKPGEKDSDLKKLEVTFKSRVNFIKNIMKKDDLSNMMIQKIITNLCWMSQNLNDYVINNFKEDAHFDDIKENSLDIATILGNFSNEVHTVHIERILTDLKNLCACTQSNENFESLLTMFIGIIEDFRSFFEEYIISEARVRRLINNNHRAGGSGRSYRDKNTLRENNEESDFYAVVKSKNILQDEKSRLLHALEDLNKRQRYKKFGINLSKINKKTREKLKMNTREDIDDVINKIKKFNLENELSPVELKRAYINTSGPINSTLQYARNKLLDSINDTTEFVRDFSKGLQLKKLMSDKSENKIPENINFLYRFCKFNKVIGEQLSFNEEQLKMLIFKCAVEGRDENKILNFINCLKKCNYGKSFYEGNKSDTTKYNAGVITTKLGEINLNLLTLKQLNKLFSAYPLNDIDKLVNCLNDIKPTFKPKGGFLSTTILDGTSTMRRFGEVVYIIRFDRNTRLKFLNLIEWCLEQGEILFEPGTKFEFIRAYSNKPPFASDNNQLNNLKMYIEVKITK